jgi:hypothetical protein
MKNGLSSFESKVLPAVAGKDTEIEGGTCHTLELAEKNRLPATYPLTPRPTLHRTKQRLKLGADIAGVEKAIKPKRIIS